MTTTDDLNWTTLADGTEQVLHKRILRQRGRPDGKPDRFRVRMKIGKRWVAGFSWTTSLSEAERQRDEKLSGLGRGPKPAAGKPAPAKAITLHTAMQLVIDELIDSRDRPPAGRKPISQETIDDRLQRFATLKLGLGEDTPLHEIDRAAIETFVADRMAGRVPDRQRVSATTADNDLTALNTVFSTAARDPGLRISRNPVRDYRNQKRNRGSSGAALDRPFYEPEEFDELLAKVSEFRHPHAERNAHILAFAYFSGLRISELGKLQARDVLPNADGSFRLRVRGKAGDAFLEIHPEAQRALRAACPELDDLKPTDRVLPCSKDGLESLGQDWAEWVGEPRLRQWHALRRGCAVWMETVLGSSITEIQAYLRHRGIQTTQLYLTMRGRVARRGSKPATPTLTARYGATRIRRAGRA